MAKSTRVTITRPNTTVQLPHEIFLDVAKNSSDAHLAMLPGIEVKTYIQGYDSTTTIVDHMVNDDTIYDANKDQINSVVLWWQNDSNRAEVDTYQTSNGITVTITEETNPNISGAVDVTNLRSF
jgi:hypothetical protein